MSDASVQAALAIPRRGRVFDLGSGWWPGMPVHPTHAPFQLLTYRTPRGMRIQRDRPQMLPPDNAVGLGFVSELLLASAHSGTHIDALCHVTCGADDRWHGDEAAAERLGDFGALSGSAAELEPIVTRGVLLDIPGLLGVEHCEASFPIGPDELARAAEREGVEAGAGDAVLVRTGQMRFWPDEQAMAAADGAGVSLAGALWLAEREPVAVGADTIGFEVSPSGVEGHPGPVHAALVRERAIPILEWVNCEELAAAGAFEFLFVCLPLTIAGATGSLVRPIAIV